MIDLLRNKFVFEHFHQSEVRVLSGPFIGKVGHMRVLIIYFSFRVVFVAAEPADQIIRHVHEAVDFQVAFDIFLETRIEYLIRRLAVSVKRGYVQRINLSIITQLFFNISLNLW